MENQEANIIEAIKRSLVIKRIPDRTYITVVIINKLGKNVLRRVSCNGCYAFNGGYAYDQNADAYLIRCVADKHLGYVDLAYEIEVPNTANWSIRLPLPMDIIEEHLNASQRSVLDKVKSRYREDEYDLHIVQMRS